MSDPSFPQFMNLPPELRIKIWDLTRYHPAPRIIPYNSRQVCLLPIPEPVNQNDAQASMRRFKKSQYRRLPPCFHVCRESRHECHKKFSWLANGSWIDYERDGLFMYEVKPRPVRLVDLWGTISQRVRRETEFFRFFGYHSRIGRLDIKKLRYLHMDEASIKEHILPPHGPGWSQFFTRVAPELLEFAFLGYEAAHTRPTDLRIEGVKDTLAEIGLMCRTWDEHENVYYLSCTYNSKSSFQRKISQSFF